jgi:hypothetical protein
MVPADRVEGVVVLEIGSGIGGLGGGIIPSVKGRLINNLGLSSQVSGGFIERSQRITVDFRCLDRRTKDLDDMNLSRTKMKKEGARAWTLTP